MVKLVQIFLSYITLFCYAYNAFIVVTISFHLFFSGQLYIIAKWMVKKEEHIFIKDYKASLIKRSFICK